MGAVASSRGIAILGFPRSGTTLLRRLLDAHPNIDSPGETYLLAGCARFLQSQTVVDGVEAGVLAGVRLLGIDPQEVLSRLRSVVFELRDLHARQSGRQRWVEKSAIDAFYLDAIREIFGERLFYIGIVRHGLDVCASTQEWCTRAESYPTELHRYIVQFPQPLVGFAHAWVDVMAAWERFSAALPNDTMVVRYEQLVTSPEEELRRVLEFVGEPWEQGMIERALESGKLSGFGDWKAYGLRTIDTQSVGRYKRLSAGTLHQLAPIVNPTLVRWGYEPVGDHDPVNRDDPLRRYELGLLAQSLKVSGKPTAGP